MKYHDFTGEGATGNVDNYKVRATGQILIPEDAPDTIQFKDGVDDYTYLEINGQVLIDDQAWTGQDGSDNGGSPIVQFDATGLQGQWIDIEFGMAEGTGGDAAVLYWDAFEDPAFSRFPIDPTQAIPLATVAQDLMIPDTHLRASEAGGRAIVQPNYNITAASGASHLELVTGAHADLGTFTSGDGTVEINGRVTQVNFATSRLSPLGNTSGGIINNMPVVLTADSGFSAGGRTGTFTKSGRGDLILNRPATGTENTTFQSGGGRIVGVHGAGNPFGPGATLDVVAGGTIVLTSGGGDVAFDNQLNITGAGTLVAGQAGGGVAGPLTVTIGSAANGGTLSPSAKLELRTTDGYILNLEGSLGGDAGLVRVTAGTINLNAMSSVGSVTVTGSGSTLNINADLVTNPSKIDNQLIGRLYTIGGRSFALTDDVGDGTGTGGLLGMTPNVETIITGRIDYRDDNDFRNGDTRGAPFDVQPLGLNQNDDFQTMFTGTFTMKEDGTLALGTERSDNPVRIFLDLNQNGVVETAAGELIVTNGTGCCPSVFPPAFDLAAGDYLYVAVQHEFGGGSQIEPTFEITNTVSSNIGRTTITPGDPAQAGFWSTGVNGPTATRASVNVSDGGTLNVSAAVTAEELNISVGSTLNVNDGAAFDIGTASNLGTIRVNDGGVFDLSAAEEFISDGVLEVRGGTLLVDEDGVTVAPNHALVLNFGAIETAGDLTAGLGTFFSHGVVIGDGLEVTVGGTLNVKPEAIVALTGGKLNVSSVNNENFIALLAGEFNFTGGNLVVDAAGPLGSTVDLGSAMTLNVASGRLMVPAAGTVNSIGHIVAQGITNEGVINAISGTIQVPGDGQPTSQGGDNSDGLVNNNKLRLIDVTINGDVHSPAGSFVDVASSVVFNGLYSGGGTFTGSGLVTFNGDFSPGDSPSRVRMEGSVELTANNTLYIELGGIDFGEFDQLDIRDNISIGGTLDVSLFDGFEPSFGDVFPIILTGGVTTGQFIGLAQNAKVGTFAGVDLLITYTFGDGDDVALTTDHPPCFVFPIGDLNKNCFTDFDDLAVLLSNWDQNVIAALGNLVDADGTPVNFDDLAVLLSAWTGPDPNPAPEAALADAAVPEPSTLVLALLSILGLGACRRRRNRAA